MRHLILGMLLCGVAVSAAAQERELTLQKGRVVYSFGCESQRSFSYFDGSNVQRYCIGATDEVSVRKFVSFSRGECRPGVRVIHGTVIDNVLYATHIKPLRGCRGGGSALINR